ncbi:MAG: hypothetical protein EZS28_047863, partial [Streblomastix strix]
MPAPLILFIFALAVLSETVTPATDRIYYYSGTFDADGAVTIDYQEQQNINAGQASQQYKIIDDLAVLVNGTNHTNTNFLPVAETAGIFNALKTTIKLDYEEKSCILSDGSPKVVLYSFFGYTVKAVTGADIYPSI